MAIGIKPIPNPTGGTIPVIVANMRTAWENFKNLKNIFQPIYYTSLYGSFATLLTEIGTDSATVYVNSAVSITSNTTIPSNISIVVLKGGSFAISTGIVLTINGSFDAGDYTVFSGAGTVAGLDTVNAMWFGATNDGVDSTAAILTAAVGGNKLINIGRGIKFNRTLLLRTLPVSVVCFDMSVINDFAASGETAKKIGILSSDSAPNDTHWSVDNGHHVINTYNNHGTSGSDSADERKASVLWAGGQFELDANALKLGFRGILIDQYTRETGGTFWKQTIRSLAPWVAMGGHHIPWSTGSTIAGAGIRRAFCNNLYTSTGAGTTGATPPTHTSGSVSDGGVTWTWEAKIQAYEYWVTNKVVAVGDVRATGSNHYIAATGGTTGVTEPSHTAGTASDGAVSWTHLDSADRTLYSIDEYGRVLIGPGTGSDAFRHTPGVTDLGANYIWWGRGQTIVGSAGSPAYRRWGNNSYRCETSGTTGTVPPTHTSGSATDGTLAWIWNTSGANYVMDLAARGVSKVALLKLTPTNSSGAEVVQPYFRTEFGEGLKVMKPDGGSAIATFHDTRGTSLGELNLLGAQATEADTTPSVNGISTLYVANTVATSITGLDDGAGATGTDDQIVYLIFTNENTTMVHSGGLTLSGGVNVTPRTYDTMCFRRIQNFYSDRWIEVGRSWPLASVFQVLWTKTANTTVANTVTETTLLDTGVGTKIQPAAFFTIGKTLFFDIVGFYSTLLTPTIQFKFKLGAVVVLDSGAIVTATGAANQQFRFRGQMTCRTTGATGTIQAQGEVVVGGLAVPLIPVVNTATTTINTTGTLTADITMTWGTANAANTITATNAQHEAEG